MVFNWTHLHLQSLLQKQASLCCQFCVCKGGQLISITFSELLTRIYKIHNKWETERERMRFYLGFSSFSRSYAQMFSWGNYQFIKIIVKKHLLSRHFLLIPFFYHHVDCFFTYFIFPPPQKKQQQKRRGISNSPCDSSSVMGKMCVVWQRDLNYL